MSDLSASVRARIDALLGRHPVLLFMKGHRTAPACGFSAKAVGVLDGWLDHYDTIDILADDELRSGMKVYGDWPTFPQLWVKGELVGGSDILLQLHESGDIAGILGADPNPPAPQLTITEAAAAHIARVLEDPAPTLRLTIDASYQHRFSEAGPVTAADVTVSGAVLSLVLDRGSARRAEGLVLDLGEGADGQARLVIDNPNEPARLQSLMVEDYAAWRDDGRAHQLLDVRTPEEFAMAHIEGARLVDDETLAWLDTLPRDTTLVMQCHHGIRSRRAGEFLLSKGFTDVHNLEGGIDAWSLAVDSGVPRY